MKILLDTHTFLWFVNDDPNLSNNEISLLESDTDLAISIASLWEIAIKVNLGKLTLADAYDRFISQQIEINEVEILAITTAHLAVVSKLPLHHRDPFDRLIISQAISEKIPIISIDSMFDSYEVKREW